MNYLSKWKLLQYLQKDTVKTLYDLNTAGSQTHKPVWMKINTSLLYVSIHHKVALDQFGEQVLVSLHVLVTQ